MDAYLQVWLATTLTVLLICTLTGGTKLGVIKDAFYSSMLGRLVTSVFWGIGLLVGV